MTGETRFRPTIEDYIAANRAWFWRALLTRKFFGVVAVGVGVVAVMGIVISWSETDASFRLHLVGGMGIGFIAWMAIGTGLGYALQPRAARRLFRQHRALNRDYTFGWDTAGTRFTTSNGYSDTPWHDYHGWYDGRAVLLLMLNDRLFHFIPHRALDPEQLADLRALAPRPGELPS